MMKMTHTTIHSYRIAMAGLLAVFAVHILIELAPTPLIGYAVAAISLGVLLSGVAAKHFGHGHRHAGDSAIDAIPVAVLIFANIAHPAIDGFSAVETFRAGGVIAGSLYALSIVFHEILRQSAFITALAPLRIKWGLVVATAFLGTGLGIAFAAGGITHIGRYEPIADLATLFSYSFVIAEFHFLGKEHSVRRPAFFFAAGALISVVITFLAG